MVVQVKEISVAHSPDSDDAFMFYALAKGLIDTNGLKINQVMNDIQSLNHEAIKGRYEVSAISFAAYPHVKDKYILTPCGSSMGDNYGPVLVAPKEMTNDELLKARIAIPGKLTSAYLTLRLYLPGLNVFEVPFNQIIDEVKAGNYDAGLLIHEGQLTYQAEGLKKIVDLGEWWHKETGLPLPLGGNVIRRDLGEKMIAEVTALLKRAIEYSLDHREEALEYALTFARDMPTDLADKFVAMYVNKLSVDSGEKGRAAVIKLFEMANEKGLYDEPVVPEFVTL
jgi:1,4-dihydroxy-6-naphthoate synthase